MRPRFDHPDEIDALAERYLRLVRDPYFRGITFRQYLSGPRSFEDEARARLRLWGCEGGIYLPKIASLSYLN